jgi:hypothetical protein
MKVATKVQGRSSERTRCMETTIRLMKSDDEDRVGPTKLDANIILFFSWPLYLLCAMSTSAARGPSCC